MTNLSELADVTARGARNEPEPIQLLGYAPRTAWIRLRRNVRRRSGRNGDCCCVLNEITAEAVRRIAEVSHSSGDTLPFDVERIDDSLDQISQGASRVKTVGHGKSIEHANVSYVQGGSSVIKINMGTSFWNTRYPGN